MVAVVAAAAPWGDFGGGALDKTRLRGRSARVCGLSSLQRCRGAAGAILSPFRLFGRARAKRRVAQWGPNPRGGPRPRFRARSRYCWQPEMLSINGEAISSFFLRDVAGMYVPYGPPERAIGSISGGRPRHSLWRQCLVGDERAPSSARETRLHRTERCILSANHCCDGRPAGAIAIAAEPAQQSTAAAQCRPPPSRAAA